jgi:hypothetical protein
VPVTERSNLMRSVNDGVAFFAADANSPGLRWTFACECGSSDCAQWVELDLAQYEQILATDGSVLAEGHLASPVKQARAKAGELREGARALRAQAKHQRKRARRLSG